MRSGRVVNTLFTFQRRPECGQETSQRPHSSGRYGSAARAPAPPRPTVPAPCPAPGPAPSPARRHAWPRHAGPQPARAPPGGGAARGEQASGPYTPCRLPPPSTFPTPLSSSTQSLLMERDSIISPNVADNALPHCTTSFHLPGTVLGLQGAFCYFHFSNLPTPLLFLFFTSCQSNQVKTSGSPCP